MRQHVRKTLEFQWLGTDGGYGDHLESLAALGLTDDEKRELSRWVVKTPDGNLALGWLVLMGFQPAPLYRDAIVECLESDMVDKVVGAIRALVRGEYAGALDAIFASEHGLRTAGDLLPWELATVMDQLTPDMQRRLAHRFCDAFADFPEFFVTEDGEKLPACLLSQHHDWLRAMAQIEYTDDRVAETLVWIWKNLARGSHDKYLLLAAMASNPVTAYGKFLAANARSRIRDLRDAARAGLKRLRDRDA